MKIDASLNPRPDAGAIAKAATRLEESGYDAAWVGEAGHDAFLPLAIAAEHTSRIELGTNIAVAFARNPLSLATLASDLQALSEGRFLLGLGSQIRAHIEKRYSMAWSSPAARMRELIQAMHAIWRAWNEGERLDFRGDFYTHTLMTPFFSPEKNPWGPPKIFVAAVGPMMTAVAGEVADGLLVHPFTTERFLRTKTLPLLNETVARSDRQPDEVETSLAVMFVTGSTEEAMIKAARAAKRQIAFYASTPAYRPVLELHGWEQLQPSLNALSKEGRWKDMIGLIDDEVLSTFAVVAEPDDMAEAILGRYGNLVDRISLYATYGIERELLQGVSEDLFTSIRGSGAAQPGTHPKGGSA